MFLFGDSLKSCCVAIVVPDEEVLMKWAKDNGRESATLAELCQDAVTSFYNYINLYVLSCVHAYI